MSEQEQPTTARHAKTFRLRPVDLSRLDLLKHSWQTTEAAVIRRLLLEAANAEGIRSYSNG